MQVIVTDTQLYLPNEIQPKTSGSAAIDLKSSETFLLLPNETRKVDSGLRFWIGVELPTLVGLVFPRSGSGNRGLIIANQTGVIDSDYQGPLYVTCWNRSNGPIKVERGDRIAQILFMPIYRPVIEIVSSFAFETERGQNGFGSTGR